jgi:small GTP-binding protein
MIQKKICLLGAFAVGKTSLIKRFVKGIFDDKYLSTVGVKIDKKLVTINDERMMLIVWDMEGTDVYNNVRESYLRGASGYLLVVDGTRRDTFEHAMKYAKRVEGVLGRIPNLVLLNKSDLIDSWELDDEDVQRLEASGAVVRKTSAKTGDGVERAFLTLGRKMMDAQVE